MKVVIGQNPPVDSDRVGVIMKFSKEELEKIRSLPANHDIVVFHPSHWKPEVAQKWALDKSQKMKIVGVTSMESEEKSAEPSHESVVNEATPPVSSPPADEQQIKEMSKSTAEIVEASKPAEVEAPIADVDEHEKDSDSGNGASFISDDELLKLIGAGNPSTNTSVEIKASVSEGENG
jgi:hypothetical protein